MLNTMLKKDILGSFFSKNKLLERMDNHILYLF
jgi:hypothetical protein